MALIKCPDCGKEFSSYATECPQCGFPVEAMDENFSKPSISCPECGAVVDRNSSICPNCGYPITGCKSLLSDNIPKNALSVNSSTQVRTKRGWIIIGIVFVLLFLVAGIVFRNHKTNNDDYGISHKSAPMQYTVSFSDDFLFPVKGIIVYECTENGDKIFENEFISGKGQSKTFTAQPQTQKIKVYLSLQDPLTIQGEYNGWLPLVYYLSPDEIKVIRIDNHVKQQRIEP